MDARSEEKRKRLEQALEKGMVMIHLDARRPGVVVPARLKQDHHLRLNLSMRFSPPDLTTNEWGVRETLSFDRTPFKIAVPWQAIFAISGSAQPTQAWLFPEDMPTELLEAAAERYGLSGEEIERLKQQAGGAPSPQAEPSPEAAAAEPSAAPAAEPAVRRFTPRVVEGNAEPPEALPSTPSETEPGEPKTEEKGRRGHLRLVK